MNIISRIIDFSMGKHNIETLVKDAPKAASQHKYADALSEIDKDIRNTDDIDKRKQLQAYHSELISKNKEALIKEDNRKNPQSIRVFPSFNIPKKENEGEDADPLIIADEDTNWGVIGVFDGMGGAGARKYKSISKEEEHTSAYWGSRIVRQSVQNLVDRRPLGEDPIMYIEKNLHECIKSELDKSIQDFPNANGNVLNKMVRKLPTTMALCSFEIEDKSKVTINSYWAGDSRIYLMTKDRMEFLSIDDANAEDDDPFSPINMDLAMNNAISQEREFRINKVTRQYDFSETTPILLIAATDGCFGYFKNPIEFEYMLRNCLSKSIDEKDFMDNIKQAIIDNIQQDDFSMAIEAFGYIDFTTLKNNISNTSESTLVNKYLKWRSQKVQDYENHKKKIAELEQQLISSREYLEKFHEEMEKENMSWYNKYKETFHVVNRSEITNV